MNNSKIPPLLKGISFIGSFGNPGFNFLSLGSHFTCYNTSFLLLLFNSFKIKSFLLLFGSKGTSNVDFS